MRHRWLPTLLPFLVAAPLKAQTGGASRAVAAGADTTGASAAASASDTTAVSRLLANFVDLGVRVSGRGELGGAWNRFAPCDPTLLLNCNPGLFPLLKPDLLLGVQIAGTISERIHVDVDYDQRRGFGATNRINVYYQGLAGEVLQRVELGDVSIRLPASRYLTEGVAGGSFGVKATSQLGPFDVQTIWAQQKGELERREFRLAGGRGGRGGALGAEGLVQETSISLDDADYVKGQFFFLVDPTLLAGYPHVDVLALRPDAAPASLRPARGGELHLYRDERPSLINPEQRAQLGYFLAEGVAGDGVTRHRGRFRRLVPGEDYRVHPSGLWLMLRTPLRADEALAAAYVSETGAAVGTPNAEVAPTGPPPELLLLRGPAAMHQPGTASWLYEMHQVYRVDPANSIEPGSVELTISLGELAGGATFRDLAGRPHSLLKLFGLDEDLPAERLDEARLYRPGGGLGGSYLIFPTLRPFAEPPPAPSAGLSAGEIASALGTDLNPGIYDDPDPVRRGGQARFRLELSYRVRLDDAVASFGLGAFGIREGSETLTLGGRALRRGEDYAIDYDLGQVTLLRAEELFAANPDAELRAVWEQRSIFQAAPRTLLGFSAHAPLGRGGLDLVGLYQAERPHLARPQLGSEPGANLLGGATGNFDFDAGWLDHLLGRLAGPDDAASRIRIGGELAVSLPDPNRRGATYLDDFEAGDDIPISLEQRLWYLGSRPGEAAGAGEHLPALLTPATAAPLIWQHELLDGAGRVIGPRLARDLDRQIQLAGTQRTEPVLYLTFGNGAVPTAERRWRSITTVLSTTGRDLSRSEYLEFYAAAPDRNLALVLDLGAVSEDAYYFDAAGQTEGEYPDGRRWGLGTLDEEARLADGEIWSAHRDSLGLWNQPCLAEPGRRAYQAGDPRANCTRGNGEIDTEDLDGNGVLDDRDGAIFRYVVHLGPGSPYLVRDRNTTGTEFSLYRIPLRGPGAIALNGATEGSWRFVKHLRITVTGRPGAAGVPDIALARVRIAGSRWTKRDQHGIRAGLTEDRPGSGAGRTEFQVGSVSRITDGANYVSPPGVGDEVQDPSTRYGSAGVEYNEKSLRLAYRDLSPDERAETYFRYPQNPRNLMAYRELRLWALARGGRWGHGPGERLVVSIGTDSRNRYLFQTPLRPTPADAMVQPEAWLPEVAIDFEEWFELKARAEAALAAGEHTGPEPLVIWNEDSTYAIMLEDRARAPNLAAVRELGFAIYNGGDFPATGELWLDDLRLGGAVREAGLAGHWELAIAAGEFASAAISYGSRGGLFRHLEGQASYRTTAELGVHGSAQLGRLAPDDWGLDIPLNVSHTRTGHDPTFLERSDLRPDRLAGVRETGAEQTRLTLALQRATPSGAPLIGWLLDGASLRLGYQAARVDGITSRDETRGGEVGVGYVQRPAPREIDAVPDPIAAVLRLLLPRAVEESALAERLAATRLRWTPTEISFSTRYHDQVSESYRYAGITASGLDDEVRPMTSPRRGLETMARLAMRPFHSLEAGLTFTSGRDLLPAGRAELPPRLRRAIAEAEREVAGVGLGWERQRTLESRVDFRPVITDWLRPGIGYTARFRGDRNAAFTETLVVDDDTTVYLLRHYQADRQLTRSIALDPELLGNQLHALAALLRLLRPVDLTWSNGADSRFERQPIAPGVRYQFGALGYDPLRDADAGGAALAAAREGFRARGGIRLPLLARLDVAYLETTSAAYERGGGRYTHEEWSWPDLMLSWSEIPAPASLRGIIAYGAASVGYRRTRRSGRPSAAPDPEPGAPGEGIVVGIGERTGEDLSIPIRFSIALANGLSGSYTGLLGEGFAGDLTGRTEQEIAEHAVQLAGRVPAPSNWREGTAAPIHAALTLATRTRRHCRVATEGECVPFVDLISRQLGLSLDTMVDQLNLGLQVSYNDRKSLVGLRSGSSQFQLTLFGEFNFEAGNFIGGGW
jgi:hypothetical protein